MHSGLWQGWIEFVPVGWRRPASVDTRDHSAEPARHPVLGHRSHTGVFGRCAAANAAPSGKAPASDQPVAAFFDGPAAAEDLPRAGGASVLNPFSAYRKGESLLSRQLGALSSWHLVNIIDTHGLSEESLTVLNASPPSAS